MNKLSEQSGFTLIEALAAMVVFTIGILALYAMQVGAIQSNSTAIQTTVAATVGADELERIFAMNYDTLEDTDDDGLPGLGDGLLGLYDFTDATADGMATTADGFTIYWNVAEDQPLPFTKRVVVNVVRNERGLRRNVEYEYIIAELVQQ